MLDRADRRILLMGSAEGGVEIEQVAEERPGAIIRLHATRRSGSRRTQPPDGVRAWPRRHLKAAVAIAQGLVRTMTAYDADLVEINPLAIVRETGEDGAPFERLVCLDAKITLDDSRSPATRASRTSRPRRGGAGGSRGPRSRADVHQLDGTIGCMVNGAGLAMTTMDLVKRAGGEPANFLDIGGGAGPTRSPTRCA